MRYYLIILLLSVFVISCKTTVGPSGAIEPKKELNIAFGSCNKHDLDNLLWDDILDLEPDLWIWGGDNIYADTDNMQLLREMYEAQNKVPVYNRLRKKVKMLGTWDDHDYGLNDGGVEFEAKAESQQVFLDFLNVSRDDPRRTREGVYHSFDYKGRGGSVRILVLDTRYFRSPLIKDTITQKRYTPDLSGRGTILGEQQWKWLEEQLQTSKADFNLIVSSIQFLSGEHGFECWANFPNEVSRMEQLISGSGAKGVIFLSGDRHISEFSRKDVPGLSYPLVDFTSSGLTHAYRGFTGEPNAYRVGEVVSTESFGWLRLNLETGEVHMQMRGDGGQILQDLKQQY
ncbi:alkaline phosphatase D family protein [Lentiprolixibacter aurantiacus]|uniref:Alkaline phosphatase D family protein n=1 Tax=Lentiprolixibacter aurantiacus TaxID=2993939 RepID=A0AAE3MMZ9_9FLAO|nr:alkaline phosphatase D family protein [Lentiprolixibacter aurantiacus]MCX2720423.1 alkaline phosphatase D family protein [Lentiprolixibacter aurantiacus]